MPQNYSKGTGNPCAHQELSVYRINNDSHMYVAISMYINAVLINKVYLKGKIPKI